MTLAMGSAVVFGLGSVVMKSATIKQCLDHYVLLGLYVAGAAFFFTISAGNFTFKYSIAFVLASIFIALGSFLGNWAVIKALQIGPASLTAPMLNLNLPLIILMSVLFYGEQLNYIKILIILFLFLGLILVKFDPNEKLVIKNKRWFWFVFLGAGCLFLREGGLKITQEMNMNNIELLFVSYIICVLFTLITIFIISHNKKSERPKEFCIPKHRSKSLYFGLLAGICSGLGLYWYSSALAVGPASLVVLIFSSRSFVIVFFAYFLHKERLSKFQILSLVSLTIGLALSSFLA